MNTAPSRRERLGALQRAIVVIACAIAIVSASCAIAPTAQKQVARWDPCAC